MKRLLLTLVAVGGLAACGQAAAMAVASDHVALDEFTISAETGVWDAGSIRLAVDNVGERDHTIIISREDGQVVAATDIVAPDETLEFDVELPSGSYQLTCRIVVEGGNGEIFDHFEQGMRATVEVVDG